jgi:hypothetical protein
MFIIEDPTLIVGPAHLLLQYLLYTIYFAEIMILPQILHFFNYIFVMSLQLYLCRHKRHDCSIDIRDMIVL